ncbi:hypothetical protein D0Z08_05600 [Nocardioides immobilis]|uniref:Glycoside hydrolase family 2 immunoglobulin-like beta-sandwich domain-containing protein n=1 Tax=Nocardioides immobilis TaxID=2049295 RepID=A0A417Y6Z9_9ACTN|nr:hypothetical protein D0Z08_05600 [Nocardioides immobilis]
MPGLVDLAEPSFEKVGLPDDAREAFWYRRAFVLDGPAPERAVLRVGKATFGTKVFVNDIEVGEHLPNFTPGYFDLTTALRADGQENEVVIRVGATRDATPAFITTGWDMELHRSLPGIFDSVELMLTSFPYINLIRTRPNLDEGSVTVVASIVNGPSRRVFAVECAVTEASSGRARGSASSDLLEMGPREERDIEMTVPLDEVRLWSPEDPFLYNVVVNTPGDSANARFGMRTFTFDPDLNRALLNGDIYFLRGAHVIIYRTFEDPDRSTKPWDEDWVRKLYRRFKSMNWNIVRNSIGFPPDMWYRVADEEGILILDEFPLFYPIQESMVAPKSPEGTPPTFGEELQESSERWEEAMRGTPWPEELTSEHLAVEYREWIEARANNASVVAFSSQCECPTPVTGDAVRAVRDRDLQRRPWGNGWGGELDPNDFYDAHWYPEASWASRETPIDTSGLDTTFKTPLVISDPAQAFLDKRVVMSVNHAPNSHGNAILTSEYGWNWLCRDGSPGILSAPIYRRLPKYGWPTDTADQRFYARARLLAAQTEFLRANRTVAGILQQCGLASGQPGAFSPDNFADLDTLDFHPYFVEYMRDALNPVGVMVDFAKSALPTGALAEIPVSVVNDLPQTWQGQVGLRLLSDGEESWKSTRTVRLAGLGQDRVFFYVPIPSIEGRYQLQGHLSDEAGLNVSSWRDFSAADAAAAS